MKIIKAPFCIFGNTNDKEFHIALKDLLQTLIDLRDMPPIDSMHVAGTDAFYQFEQNPWRDWSKKYCYSNAAKSIFATQTHAFFHLLSSICGENNNVRMHHDSLNDVINSIIQIHDNADRLVTRNVVSDIQVSSNIDCLKKVIEFILNIDPNLSKLEGEWRLNDNSITLFQEFRLGVSNTTRPSDVYDDVSWNYSGTIYHLNKEFNTDQITKIIDKLNQFYSRDFFVDKSNLHLVFYRVSLYLIPNVSNFLFQKILFGTPGTGKSYKIEEPVNGYGLRNVGKDYKFRTTFHPDYDYAQFVGTYKPRAFQVGSQHEEETAEGVQNVANQNKTEITYEFVPQLFAKAYVKAWTEYLKVHAAPNAEKVYLVIEEINRGNCAQIFGDIFQLLDRKEGHSDYPIDVDSDFASYIKEQLSNVKQSEDAIANYWNDYKNKIQEWDSSEQGEERADDDFCKIALPPNLNILATMNTSDQSLFPMDSAFKRRFDWEYVPIDYDHPNADFDIEVGDKKYKWLDFLEKVNKNVFKVTKSEDKQMGEFFIKHSVDYKEFRSKVLFYLWDSVYKDEEGNKDAEKVFHFKLEGNQDKTLTFQTLFEGSEADQKDRIAKIMSHLDVVDQNAPPPPQQGEQGANAAAAEPAPAEEPNPAQ